ncbi:hypothetical protein CEUSTIGMA_g1727.t1 [Chlamydomonas eustigma]|uniref:Ribosome maturation protein SBDS n=1 Tax=Chlamydomonas eustigma TaxID=1157962 RepID=A0A250WTX2_9CHLO|nr:hypothetical protein CEUSTIGMA_g1727.t1 [Chlamydomonas eustigma]|eukprot:GAX74278.1 hypothetical protein CEUSTIGMA_g1727.t1 [Chlamydomonas eustigma]
MRLLKTIVTMGSRGVFQPVGQKRLTNVAIVRLKKGGYRFEIAAYQNKVRDWRNGIEKNLDDVLQTTSIFSNVSKGVLAKDKELMEAFGTTDQETICLEILKRGELQVADKERKVEYDNLFRDVASVLVEKCVNPDTNRPYTITMLERALRDVHFNLDPKKTAKQQALEALPMLKAKFPIQRARMRLKVSAPIESEQALMEMVDSYDAVIENIDYAEGLVSVVVQIEPGAFRDLHNRLQGGMQGRGRVEVLAMTVVAEGLQLDEFSALPAPPPQTFMSVPTVQEPAVAHGLLSAANVEKTFQARGMESVSTSDSQGKELVCCTNNPAALTTHSLSVSDVVYRGTVEDLPEAHASRKERFIELDALQPGWIVELRNKGSTVEAVFLAPNGEKVGAFANARRMALAFHKASAT